MKSVYLIITLCAVLIVLMVTASCGKPGLPGESTSGISTEIPQIGKTTEAGPLLTGGLTKPPLDTKDGITSMYRTEPDPALVLQRQDRVLSRLNNKTPYDELITKTMDVNAFVL